MAKKAKIKDLKKEVKLRKMKVERQEKKLKSDKIGRASCRERAEREGVEAWE